MNRHIKCIRGNRKGAVPRHIANHNTQLWILLINTQGNSHLKLWNWPGISMNLCQVSVLALPSMKKWTHGPHNTIKDEYNQVWDYFYSNIEERTLLELSLPVHSSASRKYLHPLSLGSITHLLRISCHSQHCETATLEALVFWPSLTLSWTKDSKQYRLGCLVTLFSKLYCSKGAVPLRSSITKPRKSHRINQPLQFSQWFLLKMLAETELSPKTQVSRLLSIITF